MNVDRLNVASLNVILEDRRAKEEDFNSDWVYLSTKTKRVRRKDLECIALNTSGKFAIGRGYAAFELEADAIIFKLKRINYA